MGDRLAIALGDWQQPDDEALMTNSAALVIWPPQKRITRYALDAPVGALDWVNGDKTLLLGKWDGWCRAWPLDIARTTGAGEPLPASPPHPGEAPSGSGQVQVDKDQVSAAHWSPDCPLVSKEIAELFTTRGR